MKQPKTLSPFPPCHRAPHPSPERWEMECTAKTDAEGRLVQQESYSNVDRIVGGYTFDPKDVFQGDGGGIGGRGGGRGDGTTPADPPPTGAETSLGGDDEVGGGFSQQDREFIRPLRMATEELARKLLVGLREATTSSTGFRTLGCFENKWWFLGGWRPNPAKS